MTLSNALCYPHHVPTLLLLQTHVRIENTKMKLLHERQHVDLHLHTHTHTIKQRVCAHTSMGTSFSKNLSSSDFSPGLFPAPANIAAYSYTHTHTHTVNCCTLQCPCISVPVEVMAHAHTNSQGNTLPQPSLGRSPHNELVSPDHLGGVSHM